MPGVRIIGEARAKTSVLSFVMEGIHPHDIGTVLDNEGVAIRTGQHCAQPVMDRYGIVVDRARVVGLLQHDGGRRGAGEGAAQGKGAARLRRVREAISAPMSDLRELYQEVILDHNRRPRNFRRLECADRTCEGFNPLCGDRLTLFLEWTAIASRTSPSRAPGAPSPARRHR